MFGVIGDHGALCFFGNERRLEIVLLTYLQVRSNEISLLFRGKYAYKTYKCLSVKVPLLFFTSISAETRAQYSDDYCYDSYHYGTSNAKSLPMLVQMDYR